jgi:IS5 family transposase
LRTEGNAIEPVLGHEKQDHRLGRNHLKGKEGDCINAPLSGCGFNLWCRRHPHKLRQWIKEKYFRWFTVVSLLAERRWRLAENPWDLTYACWNSITFR